MIGPIVLGALSLLFSAANLSALLHARRTGKSVSGVPFLGGLCGAGALALLGLWPWVWIPLLTDVSCVPALVLLLVSRAGPKR